jgi:hypothetical protein
MKNWLAIFAVALLVTVAFASGPFGTVSFILTFLTARYLFEARDIGFERARMQLGIAPSPPLWQRSNWRWLEFIFDDDEKFWKTCAVAAELTAFSLMLSPVNVGIVAVVIATCFAAEIARLTAPAARLSAAADRDAQTLPAAPMPRVVRVITSSPAAAKPAKKSAPAPAKPAAVAPPAPAAARAKSPPATAASASATTTATPKLKTVPVPEPQPPAPTAKAAAKAPPAPIASTPTASLPDRQLDAAPNGDLPPRQPAQQLPLRRQQRRQPAQQKPQSNRPVRPQLKRLPRRKRPPVRQQSQLPGHRPKQPSKKRPLRKPSLRRPPPQSGRPARQQPRLATHRPAQKLRRRKPDR